MADLKFTLIQADLTWEDKEANLAMFESKIRDIGESTHVVVLPEMFSTGFSMKPEELAEDMNGHTLRWMEKMAVRHKIILTGSLIIKDNGRYYNRLIWMLPDGEYGCYDKRHLFAFGNEDRHYSAGKKRLIASVKGWKINLQVCYDLRFPVWARQQTSNLLDHEYDLLIYVANWPEKRNIAWKTLLQARAIENQSYVIGVNRVGKDGNGILHSGDSSVIDPLGEILYRKENVEDVHTITLLKSRLEEVRDNFPFWKDSDDFMIQH